MNHCTPLALLESSCTSRRSCGLPWKRDRALPLQLEDGRELRYRDAVTMGKVYVIPKGRHDRIAGFEAVGLDVLDSCLFTWKGFLAIANKRRDQCKVLAMDKSSLDSLGNAYADEVLFEAGIAPKTFVRKLSAEALRKLHAAIQKVLQAANLEIQRRAPGTDEKLRDFLKVRGRHKEPCVRCGTPIRKAGVRGFDAYFCPTCQPETRKSGIVSWAPKG